MRHGSLFSGIGGFDLAAEWMGWENVFHCEWNEFGKKILKHYWPKSISYDDITKTDFTIHRGTIDVLSGGFPCQPYSVAGKRKGKEDDRHLWPEMLRVIREVSPTFVVGENVYGLVNWNGGLVFDEVQADLEAEGYEVTAVILPAVSVNAPHRRDRVWFIATNTTSSSKRSPRKSYMFEKYWSENNVKQESRRIKAEQHNGCCNVLQSPTNTNNIRQYECECNNEEFTSEGRLDAQCNTNESDGNGIASYTYTARRRQSNKEDEAKSSKQLDSNSIQSNASNTSSRGRQKCNTSTIPNGERWRPCEFCNEKKSNVTDTKCIRWIEERNDNGFIEETQQEECRQKQFGRASGSQSRWRDFPSQSPVCSGDDGIPSGLDGITFPKWRNESIKGYGNAIVPQVAYQIFKAIEEINQLMSDEEAKENL